MKGRRDSFNAKSHLTTCMRLWNHTLQLLITKTVSAALKHPKMSEVDLAVWPVALLLIKSILHLVTFCLSCHIPFTVYYKLERVVWISFSSSSSWWLFYMQQSSCVFVFWGFSFVFFYILGKDLTMKSGIKSGNISINNFPCDQ